MTELDIINDLEGKEYLAIDNSDLYDDSKMGDKIEDFEILLSLNNIGAYKVRSKNNNKIYAMKILDLKSLKQKSIKGYELVESETKYLEGLSHPHLVKYYKNFKIGNTLYIITDYISDSNMEEFIEAHKEMKMSIPENDIWNFMLQCMWSLCYAHSKGVIHRDIKLSNILLDNNMKVKLCNFGVCGLPLDKNNNYSEESYVFLRKEESEEDRINNFTDLANNEVFQEDIKNDVYYMGVCFYEICHFCHPQMKASRSNEEKYSDELETIIKCMLEEDKDIRDTSEEIFRKITDKFYRRNNRNSSIDSIFKCLNAYNDLYQEILKQMNDNNEKDKPFTKMYISILKYLRSQKNLSYFLYSIEYFRNMLVSNNLKIEGSKELDPKYIIAFFFEKMHKEMNKEIGGINDILQNQSKGKEIDKETIERYSKGPHLINSGEDLNRANEIEIRLNFINEILSKMNSPIINNFKALIRIKNTCTIKNCHNSTYFYNCYLLASLDIEKFSKTGDFYDGLNLEKCLEYPIITKKSIYCDKCLSTTEHDSEKVLFSFPKLLIIYIERGVNYEYDDNISFKEEIELFDSEKGAKKNYRLVGLIIRKNTGVYCSITNYLQKWFFSEQSRIKKIKSINKNIGGEVVMFFYQQVEVVPDKKCGIINGIN